MNILLLSVNIIKKYKTSVKMKRIALIFLSMIAISSCKDEQVDQGNGGGGTNPDGKGVTLNIHVPKNSLSTYAEESASARENFIDSLFIDLYEGANPTPIHQGKFGGAELDKWLGTNDSIVSVAYEVDNITNGSTLHAKVYANFRAPKVLNGKEVPIPNGTRDSSFYMSGTNSSFLFTNGSYKGEVHLIRNVAKLRTNISLNSVFMPSDLKIKYDSIKIEVVQTPENTTAFGDTPTNFPFTSSPARSGSGLRKAPAPFFSDSLGGQIDSLYLYENLRSDSYTGDGTNATKIKITIPTLSASEGNKTAEFTYELHTNISKYAVLRNYIYTLDIKVRGQSLDPLITLDITPWEDVSVDGSILGTYLTMDASEIVFDSNGESTINFCTDAQAVYFNFDDFNQANSGAEIGFNIDALGVEDADQHLAPDGFKDGQILLDKQHCGKFTFKLFLADFPEFPNVNFSGSICMKAGNIVKCLTFPGRTTYDAHFIVGEPILNGETFTNAIVTEDDGTPGWLKISKNRPYNASDLMSTYSGTATSLYLQLDENLSGSSRTGSITLLSSSGVEKKVYITQLPAIPIGRFGYTNGSNVDDSIYTSMLYAEQLYEFDTRPFYVKQSSAADTTPSNAIYNGRFTAINPTVFDFTRYTSFNYNDLVYQAINYCAQKNRITSVANLNTELKWYLPAQAQLMAMWLSFHGMDTTKINFATQDTYWSSTDNHGYAVQAQYADFRHGNVGHYNKTRQYWARCVRDGKTAISTMVTKNGTSPNEYPVIDFSLGMPSGSYVYGASNSKTNSASNPNATGDEWGSNNKTLYQKLRVANVDASSASAWSATACSGYSEVGATSGWRLPTQRELQAIWTLQYEIKAIVPGFELLGANYYWSATTSASVSENRWVIYGLGSRTLAGSSGNAPNHINTDNSLSIRCVREN